LFSFLLSAYNKPNNVYMKEVTIMKPAKDFLRRPFTTRVPQLLVQSIIIGLIIGMIVSFFRFVIEKHPFFILSLSLSRRSSPMDKPIYYLYILYLYPCEQNY